MIPSRVNLTLRTRSAAFFGVGGAEGGTSVFVYLDKLASRRLPFVRVLVLPSRDIGPRPPLVDNTTIGGGKRWSRLK